MAKSILVVGEQLRGEISDVTYEMLGAARTIARAWAASVQTVLFGSSASGLASKLGAADKVFVADDPQLDVAPPDTAAGVVQDLVEKTGADLVFVGCTNVSLGIGSILAQKTRMPLVNFCRHLSVEGDALVCTSQLFGGKILTDVKLANGRGIVGIYPGTFPIEQGRVEGVPLSEKIDFQVQPTKVRFKRYIEPETGDVDITKQDVLVAVGRGIQTQENVQLAEELAQVLGVAVCASRPIIDQGWLPLTRQVGKSGMTVKPRVYLAFGISGAPEHWEGMQNSQCIIAVNTDPKAPIFDGAHYGVVGDAVELLPIII
ncbi:MAG: electron transfer flavoprotein subunit alpha/FixB family protein [Verrucomicrobiae bacterium]|nr:electron transfer flavoprotein subunit alpha/FixB family protein [Verrucomicrobiae bacterium]